jgi:hypothetical protein
MSKPILNNKIIYNNVYGLIDQHEKYLNQGVRNYNSPTFANLFLTGNATIQGNLTVEGNTSIFNTNITEFEDNIILLNRLESSSGVSLNQAGLEVERGSSENYRIVYQESDQTTRIGVTSHLEAVVVREDSPLANGIMIWNDTTKRIESTATINLPTLYISSTVNALSSTSGSIHTDGGVGIKQDLRIDGRIYYKGTSNSNPSVTWTDTNNSFNITSPNDINVIPTNNVIFPYDKKLIFGSTSNNISFASGTNNMSISGIGNINFNINSTKAIIVPNSVPIIFSTVSEKVFADSSSNMTMQSSNDINLIVGTGKRVLIQNTFPLTFGNNNQQIFSNSLNDLNINAGNNINIGLSAGLNVVIPSNAGVKFGSTGTQRIYVDNNADLNIQSSNNINFVLPTTKQIIIPTNTSIAVGTSLIQNNNDSLIIQNTNNTTNVSSGALVVSGGMGIVKDLQVGGDLNILGNFTVQGTTTIINTETLAVEDNIIIVNSLSSTVNDSGIMMKRTTGNYSGMFYKESTNEMTFAYSTVEPTSNVVITDYLPLRSKSIVLTDTMNSFNSSSGSLIVLGGASIQKTLYVNEIVSSSLSTGSLSGTELNITSITTTNLIVNDTAIFNSTSVSLLLNGSMNVNKKITCDGDLIFNGSFATIHNTCIFTNTENSVNFTSGGAITNLGGMSISKDLYVNGRTWLSNGNVLGDTTISNLNVNNKITIENTANVTGSDTNGSLVLQGGLYTNKNIRIGGDLLVNNKIDLFTNSFIDKYTNVGASDTWMYLGPLTTGYTQLKIENKNTTINCNIDGTFVPSISYQGPRLNVIYVYIDTLAQSHLFVLCKGVSTTFISVNSSNSTKLFLQNEGTASNPDGTFSNWLNTWTLTTNNNLNYIIGDADIQGQTRIYDNTPIIGSGSGSQHLGVLYKRDPTNIITDLTNVSDIIPDQTGAALNQVILSNATNNTTDFYLGQYIRINGETKGVISYSGGTRVLTLDSNLLAQPVLGDTITIYPNTFVYQNYNENTKEIEFGYTSYRGNDTLGFADIKCNTILPNSIQVLNTENVYLSNSTLGSILSYGGINIKKNVVVKENVIIGGIVGGITSANLLISNTQNNIVIQHSGSNYSQLDFIEIGNNNGFGVSFHDNLLMITGTTSGSRAIDSQSIMSFSTNGNIGIHTTQNNNLITLKNNNYIASETDTGFLGLKSGTSKIEIYGDNISSGNIVLSGGNVIVNPITKFTNTMVSSNSSSGSLVVQGSICITSTANSVSYTNGSCLTIAGGASINKDLYIGGNLYVNGFSVTNAVTSPTLTFYDTINSTTVSYSNVKLINVNNELTLSFNVSVTPTASSENTEIEFDLPSKSVNLINSLDTISYVSGYTDTINTIVLQNILSIGKTGTTRNKIKFHSVSTGVHYLQVVVKYTATF